LVDGSRLVLLQSQGFISRWRKAEAVSQLREHESRCLAGLGVQVASSVNFRNSRLHFMIWMDPVETDADKWLSGLPIERRNGASSARHFLATPSKLPRCLIVLSSAFIVDMLAFDISPPTYPPHEYFVVETTTDA
jgi:hypothetical protein